MIEVISQTASDIMKTTLITTSPDCSLGEATQTLLENRISGLPVTTDDGTLVGVISEFALLSITYDPESHVQTVDEHMTRHVIHVGPDASLTEMADAFILHRIRRLPVVKDGKLVGLVSRRELLRSALDLGGPICESARNAVVAS